MLLFLLNFVYAVVWDGWFVWSCIILLFVVDSVVCLVVDWAFVGFFYFVFALLGYYWLFFVVGWIICLVCALLVCLVWFRCLELVIAYCLVCWCLIGLLVTYWFSLLLFVGFRLLSYTLLVGWFMLAIASLNWFLVMLWVCVFAVNLLVDALMMLLF